jgi:hypothetical protein
MFIGQFSSDIYAQNLLDDNLDEDKLIDSPDVPVEKAPGLVNETIKNISSSQKIFVISNENQAFDKGDFISLLLQNKLVARALVAKSTDAKLSGIKIVKVYSLDLWKQLDKGKEVQILRGDDSYFSPQKLAEKDAKEKAKKKSDPKGKLKTEDDLYNTTTYNEGDDNTLEESSQRHIKTDNLLSLNVGMIDGVSDTGSNTRYAHLNGSWSYQLIDNTWVEFTLGSNTIKDFPAVGVDTRMIAYSARLKYTISAPFYSYIQPYLGYQVIVAQSPGAQNMAVPTLSTGGQTVTELQLVDQLKKSRVIAGATILRRIVPGWFARIDLGTDLINGGLLLEF